MKKLINLLVIGLALVSAVQFGIPFYHYITFKSELKELSKLPSGSFKRGKTDEMMVKVQEKVRDFHVPVKDEDITLTRGATYTIEVYWEETVNWLGIYQKTFQFDVDTSRD